VVDVAKSDSLPEVPPKATKERFADWVRLDSRKLFVSSVFSMFTSSQMASSFELRDEKGVNV